MLAEPDHRLRERLPPPLCFAWKWNNCCELWGSWWISTDGWLAFRWPGEDPPPIGTVRRLAEVPDRPPAMEVELVRVGLEVAVSNQPDWMVSRDAVVLDWVGPVAVNRKLIDIVQTACCGDAHWRCHPRRPDAYVSAWVGNEPQAIFRGDASGDLVRPVRPAKEG